MKIKFAIVMCYMTITIGISLVSCHDELFPVPVSQITSSSFWNTADDANGGLNGMYYYLRSQAGTNFFLWGEARSESQVTSLGVSTGYYPLIFNNTLDRINAGPNWREMYLLIHHANLIIKYVPDIKFNSENEKNNILAQAYAMRAFVYFVMTKTWGDLPIVTEPTESYDPSILQRGRSSQADVFTLIKSDVDEALKLFPTNQVASTRNYWSKPATNVLKADIYLWTAKRNGGGTADLNIALEALNEAETNNVVLLDNFASIFDYDNKGNNEILMSITFKYLESESTYFYYMYIYSSFMPPNIDPESKEAIGVEAGASSAYWQVSPIVRQQFSEDDQRKKATFIEVYTIDDLGNKSLYVTLPCKFSGTVINGVRNFIDDVVLYRYADILLLRAEVKNALGQDPSSDINKIRQRAYQENYNAHVFVNGSKEDNDAAILKERLLEFYLEGKYWWDLIRFDKVFELVPSLVGRGSDRYLLLWPIPYQTFSLEPAVTQNTGWE